MAIDWDGVIIAGIFTGICLLAVAAGNQLDKERKEKVKRYFESKGFSFTDSPGSISENYRSYEYKKDAVNKNYNPKTTSEHLLNTGYKFDIFDCGVIHTYSVGIYKRLDNIEINIMNYRWETNDINYPKCSMFILCQLRTPNVNFPDFYIRQKGFMDNFKYEESNEKNIIIEKDKDFSDRFIINSSEQDETIAFFNHDNVRDAFRRYYRRGFSFKANGQYLLVYRDDNNDFDVNKRVDLMETALAIFRELKPYIECEEKILSKTQMIKKAKSNRKK
ncbi:MAG: hypothetical protein II961_03465 [Candidatus Riflebacteria bacterium]|nr:hypothetical protein [Candidatus Riflebacteria bacterium]